MWKSWLGYDDAKGFGTEAFVPGFHFISKALILHRHSVINNLFLLFISCFSNVVLLTCLVPKSINIFPLNNFDSIFSNIFLLSYCRIFVLQIYHISCSNKICQLLKIALQVLCGFFFGRFLLSFDWA